MGLGDGGIRRGLLCNVLCEVGESLCFAGTDAFELCGDAVLDVEFYRLCTGGVGLPGCCSAISLGHIDIWDFAAFRG